MSHDICLLEDILINKIAAGEVIENPSSVVKELVENSLDAKASKIEVDVKGGGKQLIRVSDDGIGMKKEDLKMSILRHATSKIKNEKDLIYVNTMGFRGEALASIASISKIKIESFREKEAYEIYAEGGKVISFLHASREEGTSIEVKSLFFNTPVRKNFQKKTSFLTSEITFLLNRIALANPTKTFFFPYLQKKYFGEEDFKKAVEKRIKEIFSKDILKDLKYIEKKEKELEISGFIGKSFSSKKNKRGQYLFINNRVVYSDFISKAVKEGYSTRIRENEYPIFFLYLKINKELIDVNVHPQKKEVRFREKEFIREEIKKAVSTALKESFINKEKLSFNKPLNFYKKESSFKDVYFEEIFNPTISTEEMEGNNLFELIKRKDFTENVVTIFEDFLVLKGPFYEIGEKENCFIFMDLKKAFSKITFDLFLLSLEKNKKIESQLLAVPYVVDLSEEEMKIVEKFQESFNNLGLQVRTIGIRTIAIDSISLFFDEKNIFDIFNIVLEEFLEHKKNIKPSFLYAKLAKKVAILAKMQKKKFSLEESLILLEKLVESKDFEEDPLGENIFLVLKKEDIKNLFKGKKRCLF